LHASRLQRVNRAKVTVEGRVTGEIGAGLMILLGVGREDTSSVAASMAEKCANLRIFEDEQGKMNRSLLDMKGSALVVSQFTLYGDARGQRRPSFISAAPPEVAKALYEEFCEALRKLGVNVATGIFQAMMSVELVNEGPVTILLDRTKHSNPASAQESARWTRASVLRELKAVANPRVRAKMAYFGVDVPKAHGISAPVLHALAKRIGKDHRLAQQLWASGIHEARILTALIGDQKKSLPWRWSAGFAISTRGTWSIRRAATCMRKRDPLGEKQQNGAGAEKNLRNEQVFPWLRILATRTKSLRMIVLRDSCGRSNAKRTMSEIL